MQRPRVYKEFAPDHHLRQYIRCYWKFERTYDKDEFEHVFPDSSYELMFERAGTYHVDGKPVPPLFFVGQLSKPVDFHMTGMAKSWSVRFFPWGLKPFGSLDAISRHAWLPARDVMDEQMCRELEKVMDSDDDRQITSALDELFMKRLLSQELDDIRLQKILQTLRREKGTIKIKDLADHYYISLRHLGRQVVGVTGRPPHEVASRLRFEQVRDAIMHNPEVPLTFLANQYGYTDQSHLIKEFKRYADMTPSAYASAVVTSRPKPLDHINVSFLQSSHPSSD